MDTDRNRSGTDRLQMTTLTDADKTLERAISDYLAVSRSSNLYEPDEYVKAEQEAWERLQAARDAAGPIVTG